MRGEIAYRLRLEKRAESGKQEDGGEIGRVLRKRAGKSVSGSNQRQTRALQLRCEVCDLRLKDMRCEVRGVYEERWKI